MKRRGMIALDSFARLALALALAGCGGSGARAPKSPPGPTAGSADLAGVADMGPQNPAGSGATAMQALDPHGGKVSLETMTLAVPPGVLPSSQTLAVQSSPIPAPASLTAVTPVYRFSPDGATFALPLTVSFDYDGKTPHPVIYWSKPGSSSEFEALPTVVQGGKLYAAVTHFSQGLVGSATSAADQGLSSSLPVDVAGKQTSVYVSANGSSAPVGSDFTQTPIGATYWDGAAFQTLTVRYGAAGSGAFTVQAVPPGVYYLQYVNPNESKPNIVVADTQHNPSIDLSRYRIGRPDAATLVAKDVYATDPVVEADVTNSPPSWPAWTVAGAGNIGDTFELYSPSSGAYIYGSNDGASDPMPPANNQFLFHWANSGQPFVDLALPGDAPIFFRMTQSATNPLIQTVSHIATAVTMPAQIPALDSSNKALALTHVPITVNPVAGAQNYSLSFAASMCPPPSAVSPKPLAPATNPTAFVGIDTQPGGVHRGQLAGTPDLVIFGSPASATSLADLTASSVTVGNPFPASWELFGLARCGWSFQYGSNTITVSLQSAQSVDSTTVTMAPLLGAGRSAKVDGHDWSADQTLSSSTPLLTWSAPATGTALAYNLIIRKLGTNLSKVASIRTSANSFVVPANLLLSGGSYVVQLDALASGGSDSNQFINALQLPSGNAPLLSGILTVP